MDDKKRRKRLEARCVEENIHYQIDLRIALAKIEELEADVKAKDIEIDDLGMKCEELILEKGELSILLDNANKLVASLRKFQQTAIDGAKALAEMDDVTIVKTAKVKE